MCVKQGANGLPIVLELPATYHRGRVASIGDCGSSFSFGDSDVQMHSNTNTCLDDGNVFANLSNAVSDHLSTNNSDISDSTDTDIVMETPRLYRPLFVIDNNSGGASIGSNDDIKDGEVEPPFTSPALFEYPSLDRVDLFDCTDLCQSSVFLLVWRQSLAGLLKLDLEDDDDEGDESSDDEDSEDPDESITMDNTGGATRTARTVSDPMSLGTSCAERINDFSDMTVISNITLDTDVTANKTLIDGAEEVSTATAYHIWVWLGSRYEMEASYEDDQRMFGDTV